MLFFYLTLVSSTNLYCFDEVCSNCTDNMILYNSLLCIERCPFPLVDTKNPCNPRSSILFSMKFFEFTDYSANSIGKFRSPLDIPFNDPSKLSPIPTFDQGLYFVNSSHISADVTEVLSPDFKFYITGLFKEEGNIIEVQYSSISFIKVYLQNSSIFFEILVFSQTKSEILRFSQSWVTTDSWMNIWLTLVHENNDIVNIAYGNGYGMKFNSMVGIEFRPGQGNSKIILGSQSSESFRGFLFEFDFYLGNSTSTPKLSFREECLCDFNEFCNKSGACVPCDDSCDDWPWCIRESCRMCHSDACSNCTSFGYKDCLSCTDPGLSPPSCGCGPNCLTCSLPFNCSTCQSDYSLFENLCLNLPYLKDSPSSLLVDYVFSSFEQYKFSVFQSGQDPATFYPLNHEKDDLIILSNRGAYFKPGSFFMSKSEFILNYQFTVGYFANGEMADFIDFNDLTMGTKGKCTITLTGTDKKIQVRLIASFYQPTIWNFQCVSVKFEDGITTVQLRYNFNNAETYSIEGFLYIQGKDKVRIDPKGKHVMIYSLVIYKEFYDIDGNYRRTDYKNHCSYNQYFNSYLGVCLNCDSDYCGDFGTDHYCKFVECDNCTHRDEDCDKGVSNYCLDEYVYSAGKCCDIRCNGCFDTHNFACLGCYDPLVLLGHTCVSSCPHGFEESNRKCDLKSPLIVHILFNDIFYNFTDETGNAQISAGNESTIYPTFYDSHPIPVYSRGFYFRNISYVTVSELMLSYNLTLYFIMKIQKAGRIIETNDFLIYMVGNKKTILRDNTGKELNFDCLSFDRWIEFYIQMSGSKFKNYQIIFKSASSIFDSGLFYYYFFTENSTEIILGSKDDSFIGFLYEFRIYNSIINPISTSSLCKSSLNYNCYMDCELNQILIDTKCVSCNNCEYGCRNNRNCYLCLDPLCELCSLTYNYCLKCKSNSYLEARCKCNDGFYFDIKSETCIKCLNNCLKCNNAETCFCPKNFHNENLTCVCDPGFALESNGTCSKCHSNCLTCTTTQPFKCTSCSNYLFSTLCLETCPFGFIETEDNCTRLQETVVSLEFNGKFNIEGLVEGIDIKVQGTVPSWMRGRYIGNNEQIKMQSKGKRNLLGIQFSIVFWLKVSEPGVIFSVFDKGLKTIELLVENFELRFFILLDKLYVLRFAELKSGEWTLICLFLDYNLFSSIALSANSHLEPWLTLSEFPYNNTNEANFFIGSVKQLSKGFQGFIFEFGIKNIVINHSSFLSFSEDCGFYPSHAQCISNCEFSTFEIFNKCKNCQSTCKLGCRNENHCNLCQDQYCEVCSGFGVDECLTCNTGFEFVNGIFSEICSLGQYLNYNSHKCERCKNICIACDTFFKCTKCISNSFLNQDNMCECIKGFELKPNAHETKCVESYFNVTLTVSSNNQITLIFEEELENPLQQSELMIKINQNIEKFSITQLNSSCYLIIIDDSLQVELYDDLIIGFTTVLYSKSNKLLYNSKLKALLYGKMENKNKEEYVENLRISTSNAVIVITSIVFGFSVLNMDIKSFINFKNSVELFYSAIFLDIEYDMIMETVLNQIRYSSTLPSFFEKLVDSSKGVKLNSKLKKFGFKTNLFVINSGMQIMLLIVSSVF